MALKSSITLYSVLPAAQSSMIDVNNKANPLTNNNTTVSAEQTSSIKQVYHIQISI